MKARSVCMCVSLSYERAKERKERKKKNSKWDFDHKARNGHRRSGKKGAFAQLCACVRESNISRRPREGGEGARADLGLHTTYRMRVKKMGKLRTEKTGFVLSRRPSQVILVR